MTKTNDADGLVRLTKWYKMKSPMTVRGEELNISFICPACRHISHTRARITVKTMDWMQRWAEEANSEEPERNFKVIEHPKRKGWIALYAKAVYDEDLLGEEDE